MRAFLDRFMLLWLSAAITGHDWFLLHIAVFTDSGCPSYPFPSASLLAKMMLGFMTVDISTNDTAFFFRKI
jgi:hypothetical protein